MLMRSPKFLENSSAVGEEPKPATANVLLTVIGRINKLAWCLLFFLFFVVLQIFRFHWKLHDNNMPLDVAFEMPHILATSRSRQFSHQKQSRPRKSLDYKTLRMGQREPPALSGNSKRMVQTDDATVSIRKRPKGGGNGNRRMKKNAAKYLEDITPKERYQSSNSSSSPVIEYLKKKHHMMQMRVIPTSRWAQLDNTTCIPSNQTLEDWDYRAPYALILGAQKGGSSALANYLYSHKQIVPTRKELHFLSERMDYYNNDFEGIDQEQARSHYLRHIKSAMNRSGIEDLSLHPHMHVIDATPMYLPKSDRVPQRVLCLCPWAKLIVLLREPISRAYSQFNMDVVHAHHEMKLTGNQKRMMRLGTFDDFIQSDYDTLIALGVLLPENATESERQQHYGSKKELEAWKVYTKLGTLMPIGRGLYAIQLRHWIKAYAEKDQPLRMMVINSEDMKGKTESMYLKVLDFLDIPHQLPKTFNELHKHEYNRIEPISPLVQALLERVFEPYNRQLGELIGPEWEGVWQYSYNGTVNTER